MCSKSPSIVMNKDVSRQEIVALLSLAGDATRILNSPELNIQAMSGVRSPFVCAGAFAELAQQVKEQGAAGRSRREFVQLIKDGERYRSQSMSPFLAKVLVQMGCF